jgi:radical SAM protein with 4Fe4S-binding SPASM domain
LRCRYCRTAACKPSQEELTAEEIMRVADQLIDLGAKAVVLTGGEPTQRDGWDAVAQRLARGGVRVRLFTSGFGFGADMLSRALRAGVTEFAVSLDGSRAIHDELRPYAGAGGRSSYEEAVKAIRLITERGCQSRIVTAVSKVNASHLREIYKTVKDLGVSRWQVHLCQNQGRAQNRSSELMCALDDVEEIVKILLLAARERAVLAPLHCTIGYMTEEEPVLRNRESAGTPVWRGCGAGIASMAITAEGGVKGCAALPDDFITASLRDRSLEDIWRDDQLFPYSRCWSSRMLAGACAACAFKETCRAGCPAVAYGATGAIGLNPYCLRLIRERRL